VHKQRSSLGSLNNEAIKVTRVLIPLNDLITTNLRSFIFILKCGDLFGIKNILFQSNLDFRQHCHQESYGGGDK